MLKRSIDFDLFRQNPPYEAMIFHVYIKPKLETEKEGEVYYIPLTSSLEFEDSNFPFIVETPWSDMLEGMSQSTGMAQIVILQSWTQHHLALIHLLNNSLSNDNKFVLTEQHYQFYTEKSYNYLDIDFRKIHPKLIENHHPSPFLIRISENQFIDESMVDICTSQTKDREICQDAYEYANEKQMALFRQYYEQIEYEALQFYEHLKDQCGFYPHSVLDIGANRGLWSGRMRKYFFPEAHYFLVEGNEECIDFYHEKKLPYPYEHTLIGNYTGKITFYTNPNDKYAGGNSIFRETSIEFSSYFKPSISNITTIDELMHRRKIPTPINLLKFDIQGGEYDGLLGGEETLKSVEVIQTECPIVNYNEGSATFLELHTLLKSYDFDLFQIMQTLTDGRSVGIQFDAIWVKRSSQLWNESCTSSKPMNMLSKKTERWLSTFRNRYERN